MPPPIKRSNGKWNWDDNEDFLYGKAQECIDKLKERNPIQVESDEEIPF